MTTFKIHVNDRSYQSWEVFDTDNFNKIVVDINPIENKLFTNDIFSIDKNNKITILHSSIRTSPSIPCVLILNGNKTYGRDNKYTKSSNNLSNKLSNKLLYKCIPDDIRLPSFLVPYEIKTMGFSKVFKNLYVTINYREWNDKHPIAKLDNVIGPVDIINNFYEYQLYCKSLNSSIQKFQKDTIKTLETKCQNELLETIIKKYPNIQDRTDKNLWHIITIDPVNSIDFDDGISIINLKDGVKQLSIYISNVTIWMDVLNLWNSFSRRISTIYLPDKKRPMLPTILSDRLCSLQENMKRVAFVMDIFIKEQTIIDVKYCNAIIEVSKNYIYEDVQLLTDKKYHIILDLAQKLSIKYKYNNNVRNSYELVSYLMTLMNFYCAKELIKHNTGIFRTTIIKKQINIPEDVPEDIPEDVSKFIKIWTSTSGQYIDGSKIVDFHHSLLDVDAYIHITSPIRRLVDILNMIQFQISYGIITLSENATKFYSSWLNELEYINTTMRSIRKVQCDSSLLDLCNKDSNIIEREYNGYLFDKMCRNDGLYQYVVFLPELKLSSRISIRDNFNNFLNKKFKLYIFNDEERFKKKIRLQIL
jgi:exoribonuclease R